MYKRQKPNIAAEPGVFFRCAAGEWQWVINPYGRLNICTVLREPSYDVLGGNLTEGKQILSDYVKKREWETPSRCKTCARRSRCLSCPGKAKLEMGDEEMPIPYYCKLTKLVYHAVR